MGTCERDIKDAYKQLIPETLKTLLAKQTKTMYYSDIPVLWDCSTNSSASSCAALMRLNLSSAPCHLKDTRSRDEGGWQFILVEHETMSRSDLKNGNFPVGLRLAIFSQCEFPFILIVVQLLTLPVASAGPAGHWEPGAGALPIFQCEHARGKDSTWVFFSFQIHLSEMQMVRNGSCPNVSFKELHLPLMKEQPRIVLLLTSSLKCIHHGV